MITFWLVVPVIFLGTCFENHAVHGLSTPSNSLIDTKILAPNKNIQSSTEIPYYNLTDALNNQKFGTIKDVLSYTSNVYYSTDSLISNIQDLSWVAETLMKYQPGQNKHSICLMISFEIANTNKSDIDWQHMSDILYNKFSKQGDDDLRVQGLRKTLCKVALDFQLPRPTVKYFKSQLYAKSVDISFTKYTKGIISTLMGPYANIPVGIIYSEKQAGHDDLLLEQEMRFSDFIIVNVPFSPIARMPLLYKTFYTHLKRVVSTNLEFLFEDQIIRKKYFNASIPVTLMITWEDPELDLSPNTRTPLNAFENILNSSEATYLELFKEYTGSTIRRKQIGISVSVVSGTHFDFTKAEVGELNSPNFGKIAKVIPYLYAQQVDTTPCQMKSMLSRVSDVFESLMINEYTWSSLVNMGSEMRDSNCVSNNKPLQIPQNLILFASKGIGERWNDIHTAFENLLEQNPNIADMNISTLVFNAEDVVDSLRSQDSAPSFSRYGPSNSDSGIQKFVRQWVERNISDVGCLVDVTEMMYNQDPAFIGGYVDTQCYPIFKNSSLLVWQYKLPFMQEPSYNFSFDFEMGSVKRDLFHLLVARENYKSYAPDKEIIFQILSTESIQSRHQTFTNSTQIPSHVTKARELQMDIFKWARIHNVRVIFMPAFDLTNPMAAIFPLPGKDESENKF